MKRMKNIAAAALCLAMITSLCACSNDKNIGSKLSEAPTDAVEGQEPAIMPSFSETTETVPEEDVVVPLFLDTCDIKSDPARLIHFADYSNDCCPLTMANRDHLGMQLYQLTEQGCAFTIHCHPDEAVLLAKYDAELFFSEDSDGYLLTWFVVKDEVISASSFVPLFFNQTKSVFVGYDFSNSATGTLVEMYYSPTSKTMSAIPVDDTSIYGM